jgi:hypothetical protein
MLSGCSSVTRSPSPSTSGPIAEASRTDELRISTVADPQAVARLRVIELGGSPCISERHSETDMTRLGLDLDRHASDMTGAEGLIRDAVVKAYIGSQQAAARAFGATEVLQSETSRRAVAIMPARGVVGVADGAPIGRLLVQVKLSDGRTAWAQLGDYVASVPCEPEPAAS